VILDVAASQPLAAMGVLAASLLLPLTSVRRVVALYGPVVLVAVGADKLQAIVGVDMSAPQKAAVLVAFVLAALMFGARFSGGAGWVIGAWTVVLALTFTAASWGLAVSATSILNAWGGFLFAFVALLVAWRRGDRHRIAWGVVAAPWVSLAVGLVLQVAGVTTLTRAEYTGAERLQGAVVPAHLAMLAFAAVCAACWLSTQHQRWALPAAVAASASCLATGTRGAAFACVVVLVFTVVAGRMSAGRKLLWATLGAAVVAVFVPLLLLRSESSATGEGINTSGRDVAWAFWGERAARTPWFGQGIGASTQLTAGTRSGSELSYFVVPHNMYLQLWLDIGYVGIVLVVAGLVGFAVWAVRRVDRPARPVLYGLFVAFAVYSSVDNTLVTPQMMVPLLMLVAAMVASPSRLDDEVGHGGGAVRGGDGLTGRQVGQGPDGRGQPGCEGRLGADRAGQGAAGHL